MCKTNKDKTTPIQNSTLKHTPLKKTQGLKFNDLSRTESLIDKEKSAFPKSKFKLMS